MIILFLLKNLEGEGILFQFKAEKTFKFKERLQRDLQLFPSKNTSGTGTPNLKSKVNHLDSLISVQRLWMSRLYEWIKLLSSLFYVLCFPVIWYISQLQNRKHERKKKGKMECKILYMLEVVCCKLSYV